MKGVLRIIPAITILLLMSACATSPQPKTSTKTGFLSDYSKLQTMDLESEAHVWRWVNPKLADKAYKDLVIAPIKFYPAPLSSDQVSQQSLEELRTRLTSVLMKTAQDQQLPMNNQANSGSLVLRPAITSVAASNKALSVRELIPIRLVFSGAELALGKRDKDLTVLLEYELIDHDNKQVMAQGVRADEGMPLANDKTQVTMKHFEPVITDLITDLEKSLSQLNQSVFRRKP